MLVWHIADKSAIRFECDDRGEPVAVFYTDSASCFIHRATYAEWCQWAGAVSLTEGAD